MTFKITDDTPFVTATMVDGHKEMLTMKDDTIPFNYRAGNNDLKEIKIGEGIAEIGCGAFEGCTALTKVSLPPSVKIIRSKAFLGCTVLETVVTTGKLERIDHGDKWATHDRLTAADLTSGEELCLYYEGDPNPRHWD